MDRAEAKQWIEKTCGRGWLYLVDEIFDKVPPGIVIEEVFQKWGHLHVTYSPYDEAFESFLFDIEHLSAGLCEICGKPGEEKMHDGWSIARCPRHALLPLNRF
ncbi:hypothetical protein F2P45_30345 [Massilia sp. CCM 8733]|uniref:Uncharacterized protein n=1 Tax=Massilia mucilaginosa TaxID=2609282 RepID=A0ABX0P1X5_9BURK|nr:hypothetical protein [Massilia mucilaginosa]NHZ93279.1 hypothetical protein [Massilia mucilaginosa]